MIKNDKIKDTYESPTIEIVEFTIEESIAVSGNFTPGTVCNEDVNG